METSNEPIVLPVQDTYEAAQPNAEKATKESSEVQAKRKPTASKAQPKDKPTTSEAMPKRKPTARNLVLSAIRQLKSAKGSSFADIRKYLESKYQSSDVVDVKSLKEFMKTAVEQDILEKEGGKYTIKETGKPKSKSSTTRLDKTGPGVKSSSEQISKKSSQHKEQGKPEKRKRTSTADDNPKEKRRSKKTEAESVQAE